VGNEEDARDVVQETYTEAYRRMDDFLERRPMPFHLWIRKTALEQVIKLKRKHVHASRRTVDKEAGLTQDSTFRLAREFAASSMTASTLFDEKQRAEVVRRAIVKLSVSDQEILLMRHYESLSYEEIAYILGIETATVRKRNGRALIRLHRFLRELGITESQA
jgi:RNA polymerase sigma-70 factor (ECF subfamily)